MTVAKVYRDANGVPHITAPDEATAWYALGYEQARDALLLIQYAVKGARGELAWVRADLTGLGNDIAVKVVDYRSRIEAMTEAERRTFFAAADLDIDANFWDLCVAYASGVNNYRRRVQQAQSWSSEEPRALKDWLDTHAFPGAQPDLSWVYEDEVNPIDIACQGAWTSTLTSFLYPSAAALVTRYPFTQTMAPFAAGGPGRDEIVNRIIALGGGPTAGAPAGFRGSNSFGFSRYYCQDGGVSYAGQLGDPQLPQTYFQSDYLGGVLASQSHFWFAHVKVTPDGETTPVLDVLGHVPHGSATFFTHHNRNVCLGGSAGTPNPVDVFLLRLEEDASTGTPKLTGGQRQFYSYQHDTGGTSDTYRPLVQHTVDLLLPNNTTVSMPYWRADGFGVVLPEFIEVAALTVGGPTPSMSVAYGERVEPSDPWPRWRVSADGTNPEEPIEFVSAPVSDGGGSWTTSPYVVALRMPIDLPVAGDDMHLLLTRDFWEMAHAATVDDVMERTNGGAYGVNLVFTDRAGRTFSTQLSAIPQRGDDAALFAAGYYAIDKVLIYGKALPVPARHYGDRMFDWQYGELVEGTGLPVNPAKPSPVLYLQHPDPTAAPPLTGSTAPYRQPFKPITYQDPGGNTGLGTDPDEVAFPTHSTLSSPFRVTSGQFAAACNDVIWGASRKRDTFDATYPLRRNEPAWTPSWNDANLQAGNLLLQWALEAGVIHQTSALSFEAVDRQQIAVDRFTRVAQNVLTSGASGIAPFTPSTLRADFAVSPELYSELDYTAPGAATSDSSLPTTVRLLQEVADQPTLSNYPSTPRVESPVVTANRELEFFDDLWATLFSSTWDAHAVTGGSETVSLRDLWLNIAGGTVDGRGGSVFWYADTGTPVPTWIELPTDYPLIDFLWSETQVSRDVLSKVDVGQVNADDLISGSADSLPELAAFQALVDHLADVDNWDAGASKFRAIPTSTGACLRLMLQRSYTAAGATYGRKWVRLKRGQVGFNDSGTVTYYDLAAGGAVPSAMGTLVQQAGLWSGLAGQAFPASQVASLLQPIDGLPEIPFDALYSSPGVVRTTLSPTHINALVEFFLKLGGWWVDPSVNGGQPSIKKARFDTLGETAFVASLPSTYPLTEGLQRVSACRALLDTADWLATLLPITGSVDGIPPLSACFRARAYGRDGTRVWPSSAADAEMVGGAFRNIEWMDDTAHPDRIAGRGFQPLMLVGGGSISTLLTLFPSSSTDVLSYCWVTPGQSPMGPPEGFDVQMAAFTSNTLLPSHFDDFLETAELVATLNPQDQSMPTLIVEDGTGLATANSYASIAEVNDYFALTGGNATWTAASEDEQSNALRAATAYIDAQYYLAFAGYKLQSTQALEVPRTLAYDAIGNAIAGVPTLLKRATSEVAVRWLADPTQLLPDVAVGANAQSRTSTLGPLSVSTNYSGSATTAKSFPVVDRLLRQCGLIPGGGGAVR